MKHWTKALLGSTCLTALSAGWVQAATIIVPDLPDSLSALMAGNGVTDGDLTGATLVTGSIERFVHTVPPLTGSSSSSNSASGSSPDPAPDFADWFRLTLAPGQQLAFRLSVAPVTADPSGSGTALASDIVTMPDGSPSANGSAPAGGSSGSPNGSAPAGSASASASTSAPDGALDTIFSQFTLDVLDGTLGKLSFASKDGGTDVMDGLLTAPVGGTVVFGLRDFLPSTADGLSYSLSFTYGDIPVVIGPPIAAIPAPSGLAASALGAAATAGLGFLRRRRRKP